MSYRVAVIRTAVDWGLNVGAQVAPFGDRLYQWGQPVPAIDASAF